MAKSARRIQSACKAKLRASQNANEAKIENCAVTANYKYADSAKQLSTH